MKQRQNFDDSGSEVMIRPIKFVRASQPRRTGLAIIETRRFVPDRFESLNHSSASRVNGRTDDPIIFKSILDVKGVFQLFPSADRFFSWRPDTRVGQFQLSVLRFPFEYPSPP